ncbi:hypothetical protein VNO78_15411 [Psophocarpus tetragonolobus]|uniref:phosphopantothenoylcysteine decarboxylase n=1 Tax=Psophocarpus tetragonolobus TaxID=3891 RepID=A0AAN9SGF7_PSOTE
MDSSDPASQKGKGKVEAGCAPRRKPRILVAACGSTGAVYFGNICRSFLEWAEVKAVATESTSHFTLATPEGVSLFLDEDEWKTWKRLGDSVLHIELLRWADIMVIAPLSANTLAKIAGGLCDNLLTCIVRGWDYSKPLFVAPSMNSVMWRHPFTERQCIGIDELGISLIPPVIHTARSGSKLCSMAEPSTILSTVRDYYELKMKQKNDSRQF